MSREWKPGDRVVAHCPGPNHLHGREFVLADPVRTREGGERCWRTVDGPVLYEHALRPSATPGPRPHDGQANVSGADREREAHRIVADHWGRREPARSDPTMFDVSAAIHRWQQRDPRHRQVHVSFTVHVVRAAVVLMDGSAPRVITFVRPFASDDVTGFLDGLIAVPPHEPVTMGRIDFDPEASR